MKQAITSKQSHNVTLAAPLNVVNVHLYQNAIIPMQQGGLVSKEARQTPFSLIVSFPLGATEGQAKGKLFLDEDELPEMKLGNGYSTYIDFYATASNGTVKTWSNVQEGKYALDKGWFIEKITVLGLNGIGGAFTIEVDGVSVSDVSNVEISQTQVNNLVKVEEEEDGDEKKTSMMVEVSGMKLPLGKNFAVSWKMGFHS